MDGGNMSDNSFDALSKLTAKSVTRRQSLLGLGAALGGAFLSSLGAGRAFAAAPETCVICECGTGNPCNVKSEQCQEVRAFSANVTCANFCRAHGQRLCGTGSPFHCPHGCPA
jgi:hypothetical protein